MSDLGSETRAFVPSFAPWQLKRIREAGERLIALADAGAATDRRDVIIALQDACRDVTGYEMSDFRRRVRCPRCWEMFTSDAAMRTHDRGRARECVDPSAIPELALKSGGRWGWSDAAIEGFKQRDRERACE